MSKPQINVIKPFDAKNDFVVTMTYVGNYPKRNKIIVYDAITLNEIYQNTTNVNKFEIENTIPAGILINGKKYAIQGSVIDENGNESALSDKIYFWCFETPSFYFKNINNEDKFNTASIFATLVYEQSDWEDIREFRFYLYDEVKSLLTESEAFFTTDELTYAYRGLEDDKFYYIRAIGSTINGIQMDTGYIKIFVNYENHGKYKLIQAECNERNSVVTYQTNFVVIHPSDMDTEYEYMNGWINLLDKTLVYDQDFVFNGDFTASIRCRDIYRNTTILKCSNENEGFTLTTYVYDNGEMRFKLTVPNGLCNYILYSEPLIPDITDVIAVHIRRINNIYELFVFIEQDYSMEANMWFGSTRPTSAILAQYDIWIDNGEPGIVRIDKDDVNIFYRELEPTLLVEKDYDIWIGDE